VREFVQARYRVLLWLRLRRRCRRSGKGRDRTAVLGQIPKMHAENLKRLQEWIALPSIAAEERNYPTRARTTWPNSRRSRVYGCEAHPHFGQTRGCSATIDAGARTTMAVYFMYDVKQFIPEEWSSPPLEGRLVQKAGLAPCAWAAAP